MIKECTIQLTPKQMGLPDQVLHTLGRKLNIDIARIRHHEIVRRSIDARRRTPRFVLRVRTWIDEAYQPESLGEFPLQNVSGAREAFIVGLGPAGLFAALNLIRLGIKPVIIERGKPVRARRRDLAKLTREGLVDPNSNYCFGEGGAGTFSDGKLYTRSTKRGNTRLVLDTLVQFGATREILVDSHPHIGTNKLPRIIQQMREAILQSGGEIRFESRLTDFKIQGGKLREIIINETETIPTDTLILATGHSARDIFDLLLRNKVSISAKSFAMGIRIEHPQALIDSIQYHCEGVRHPQLPAAAYSAVRQVDGKGVYSFCMCPGGIICPAATNNDEIVVNGWSPSKRNSPYANSGIVVEVSVDDIENGKQNPLIGVDFQRMVEQKAYEMGGGKQVAPAQRMTDFIEGRVSSTLPDCSYLPGITSIDLGEVLPEFVYYRLQAGLKHFGKKMKGYLTHEAVVVGVESRTSSPIRIPRDQETLMHPGLEGLFPCGEGAGYAGGIMSAAIDGQRCAEALAAYFLEKYPNDSFLRKPF